MRRPLFLWACLVLCTQACALKTVTLKSVANTLAESGDTFASDDDPELVREAVPFALKTYESLLASLPRHRGLLLATCRGFTQYSYAFVQADAERLERTEYERSMELRERGLKLYLRARLLHAGARDPAARRSGAAERRPSQRTDRVLAR